MDSTRPQTYSLQLVLREEVEGSDVRSLPLPKEHGYLFDRHEVNCRTLLAINRIGWLPDDGDFATTNHAVKVGMRQVWLVRFVGYRAAVSCTEKCERA